MSNNIFFTQSHEWILIQGKRATVGMTQYAQGELGEIVAIELPKLGKKVQAGEELCVLESTKAASDVYAPISGVVVAVNDKLRLEPGLINSAPESDGWLFQMEEIDLKELEKFLSLIQYKKYLQE